MGMSQVMWSIYQSAWTNAISKDKFIENTPLFMKKLHISTSAEKVREKWESDKKNHAILSLAVHNLKHELNDCRKLCNDSIKCVLVKLL